MTLDEFFAKLPREGWRISFAGEIRSIKKPVICPYLAVSGSFPEGGTKIYLAADKTPGHEPALRARLLAHCGLEEPGGTT